MEVILLVGIPASGKSSFYQRRFAMTHVRVNRDMLGTKARERSLFQWCLDHQQACVIDNTNTTREIRAQWIEPARAAGYPVICYYMQSNVMECLERNRSRLGSACIPDVGVRDHHARLEIPSLDEGYAALRFVTMSGMDFKVENWKP